MNIYAIGYPCSEGFAFVNVDFTRVNMQIVLTCSMDVDKATFYIREGAAFKALERLKEIDAEGNLMIVNDEDYDDEFLIENPSVNDFSVIKFSGQKLDTPEF